MLNRLWARGSTRLSCTYAYNTAGESLTATYANDGGVTPVASNTYDRRGRLATLTCGSITTTNYYHDAGMLIGESHSGGSLNTLSLTARAGPGTRPRRPR